MSGIKAGVGSTVAASQLPKLLGVPGDPDATGFFHVLNGVLRQVGDANGATVVLSIVSVAALLAMGRLVPRVPGPLIVVAAGIALIAFTGLRDRGVALIAEVPQGIPLPGVPSLHDVVDLLPGALAISVMAFLETVAVARGVRRPTEPQNDSGRVHRDRRRGTARGRDPRHVALRRRQSLGGSGRRSDLRRLRCGTTGPATVAVGHRAGMDAATLQREAARSVHHGRRPVDREPESGDHDLRNT